MRDGESDIVSVQPAIEAHAFSELLDAAVRRLFEYSGPSFVGHRGALELSGKEPQITSKH
jgi:hypothetical protein